MTNLKIAVAQVPSVKGNIDENIKTHLTAIDKAHQHGVSYIVFPELSLTGYEPELAAKLAFTKDDSRLKPLMDAAFEKKITIGVGAPLKSEGLPKIGLIIIAPSGKIEIYEKIFLHPGEEQYFKNGNHYHCVEMANTKIANAICADMNHSTHAQTCYELGASVYIAGVLISEGGYEADTAVMAAYAKKYNMLVAMANYNRPTGRWVPHGKSAIWSSSGLLAQASEQQNALVVAQRLDDCWTGYLIEV